MKKLEATKIVKAGDSARLECKITGSPEIRVVWYRNEHELQASDKYRMTFIDSVAVIQMNSLGTEDSGDFICEAQNPAGSTSCSTKVIVKGRNLSLLFLITWNPPSSPLGYQRSLLFYFILGSVWDHRIFPQTSIISLFGSFLKFAYM